MIRDNIDIAKLEAWAYHPTPLNGLSKPAHLTANGPNREKTVVAKFKGSVRNRELSLAAEVLCSLFANDLKIRVPTPFLVHISREFACTVQGSHRDLLIRSEGWNFASEYLFPGYSVVQPHSVIKRKLMRSAADILAFDVFIQNYDRQLSNPNLLTNGEEMCVIDHESAFSPIFDAGSFKVENLNLDHYYQHVLFHSIDKEEVNYSGLEEAIGKVSQERVQAYFEALPPDWRGEVDRLRKLADYLIWCVKERKKILNTIHDILA